MELALPALLLITSLALVVFAEKALRSIWAKRSKFMKPAKRITATELRYTEAGNIPYLIDVDFFAPSKR